MTDAESLRNPHFWQENIGFKKIIFKGIPTAAWKAKLIKERLVYVKLPCILIYLHLYFIYPYFIIN